MAVMWYSEARPLIKTGDVLAWRGTGPISWLIGTFTRSRYTHVGVAIWLEGELFCFEAREFKGVRLIRLSQNVPFEWVSLAGEWTAEAQAFAFAQLGRPYSWLDIFRIIFGGRVHNDGKWICSEIVRELLRLQGLRVADDIQTPLDIMEALLMMNKTSIYIGVDGT